MNKTKNRLINISFITILLIFLLPTGFVLWFMIKGMLQSSEELTAMIQPVISDMEGFAIWNWLPARIEVGTKIELLKQIKDFFIAFENSFLIVIPAILGQLFFAAPAAWALSRLRFPGKRILFGFYICLMLLPFQVTMLPNYLVISKVNLMDTLWAVILPAAFSAFPVYIMAKGFDSVPREMLEAAQVDGAGHFRIFMQIGIPIGRPGVMAALVLGFLECWSLIEQPMLFLRTSLWWPLSIYLPKLTEIDLGAAVLAGMLMMIPPMIVFMAGQKYLMLGIQFAGIKE